MDLGAKKEEAAAEAPTSKKEKRSKKNKCNIKDIEDVSTLKDMMKQSISRG